MIDPIQNQCLPINVKANPIIGVCSEVVVPILRSNQNARPTDGKGIHLAIGHTLVLVEIDVGINVCPQQRIEIGPVIDTSYQPSVAQLI